ncbi:putative bifunctional diguanylate cyclase/phosphodiesterase [Microvirga thermotolerans]|uniref:EAL domain-containing protein n=1 Tax=Microvirga thermotolerans TaxID=2651334 RepID=A0A5P9JZZ5_9HYPH|nr:bifunctional diguanylate cyclase/phosphodiesterase [Microvirga thermotolerans]QFU17741.1 EAL domain-containing protein [Microvirga thermotolerans]
MLLSRDDILAIYNSSGKSTLELLDGSAGTFAGAGEPVTAPPLPKERLVFSHSDGAVALAKRRTRRGSDPAARTGAGEAGGRRVQDPPRQDAVTGLFNRSDFLKKCGEVIAQARAAGHGFALILVGLDRFKDLNNSLGYEAGDEVLADVARSLRACLDRNDTIGRFGGDEFALLLSSMAGTRDAASMARKLLDATAMVMRRYVPGRRAGASVGVALFPDHGSEVGELVQNADIALHRAKADGRGQAQIYSPHMRTSLLARLEQLSAFQDAIEAGEIKPFYQPQMRLTDRRSYGFEALARWVQPNGEVLTPRDFETALEDPDIAILLGEHMLRSVSLHLQQWHARGMPYCKVSVNVTAPELKRGDYPEKVASLFASKGIPFSQLTVEITESVLLDDRRSNIAQTLNELRSLGVSIALDDFGTGFASLTHLKSYAVNQIKIDRSFVVHLTSSPNDRAIVRATLGLAKSLGMQTVAEGLETAAQLKCLRALGCDYGQGFLFGPAMPADQAEDYFRANRAYQKAQLHRFVLGTGTHGRTEVAALPRPSHLQKLD